MPDVHLMDNVKTSSFIFLAVLMVQCTPLLTSLSPSIPRQAATWC